MVRRLKYAAAMILAIALLSGCVAQIPAPPPSPDDTQASPDTPTMNMPTADAPATDAPTTVPDAPTTPTPTPASDTGAGEEPATPSGSSTAVVENIDIQILESFPVQVRAVISGYLPDGCTTITGIEAVNEGNTFHIYITTERPPDAMCTMALVPFEETVPLQTAELPGGTYTVVANDLSVNFELPAGAPPAN